MGLDASGNSSGLLRFEHAEATGLATDVWNIWSSGIWTRLRTLGLSLQRGKDTLFIWEGLSPLPTYADYFQSRHPDVADQLIARSDSFGVMLFDQLVVDFNAELPAIVVAQDLGRLLDYCASAYELINGPEQYVRQVASQVKALRGLFTEAGFITPERS